MRLAVLWVSTALVLSGCMLPRPVIFSGEAQDCTLDQPPATGTVLFATTRLPQCSGSESVSLTAHRGQGLIYGAMDPDHLPKFHSRGVWVDALKARLRARPALLFFHGYNNDHTEVMKAARAVRSAVGDYREVIVFTWPSYGRSAKYFWDEANVEWALPHARALLTELTRISPDLIILAHSMGNRIALDMVSHWQSRNPGRPMPVKRLIMASPDVDRGMFVQRLSEGFPVEVTLYGSRRDQPLSASWRSHGYPRAGDLSTWVTGNRNAFPYDNLSRIDVVDTSEVAVGMLKHSDYIASPQAAADLCRVVAGTGTDNGRRKIAGHPNASILLRQPKGADPCTRRGQKAAELARR